MPSPWVCSNILIPHNSDFMPPTKIASGRYPDFQRGFITQNFAGAIPVSQNEAMKHILFAKDRGYQWIELRDPDASLSLDECKVISPLPAVNYTANIGLLAEGFDEFFERVAANTALFDGPRLVRLVASPGSGGAGWTDRDSDSKV
jgi:hypothetical protein